MNILPKVLKNSWSQLTVLGVVLTVSGIFLVVRAVLMSDLNLQPVLARGDLRTEDGPLRSERGVKPPAHVLVLTTRGFEPANVSWPKGRFFLAVDNRTGISDITLFLDRDVGGRVKEVKLKMRKQRSVGIFDLPPGNYQLTEANHPGWACRITVTPQ